MTDRERIAELEQYRYRLLEALADAQAVLRQAADALDFRGCEPFGMSPVIAEEIARIQQRLRQAGNQTFRG